MATKPQTPKDPEKAEEARHLAEESIEAAEQGDRAEAKFLAEEAKELDPQAAKEILDHGKSGKKDS